MELGTKTIRYTGAILAALSLTLGLWGCGAMPSVKARPTAMPIEGVDDPEQPGRLPDFSGVILRVNSDSIVLQPSNRHPRREGEGPEIEPVETASKTEAPTSSPKRTVEISVPLANDVMIRQYRPGGGEAEFIDLLPYEIIPGQYATIWINGDDAAQYVRISMRMRVKE